MKTLEDIKEEYARENGFDDWVEILFGTNKPVELEDYFDKITKLYAKEVAREALKNASENACLIESIRNSAVYDTIDKQSILDESNIPEI